MTSYMQTPQGRRIAYEKTDGQGPCVVFLGGLMSDKNGSKAVHLEAWCQAQGRAFLRFDYSGHGQSSGTFREGAIGDWHEDTLAAVHSLVEGPYILVGSSMGGWQALLLARAQPERLAGLVTIAAAPDFTEDSYWAGFSDAQKSALETVGHVELPSDYDEPYIVTKRLIEDGRAHLVLRSPLRFDCPVRFLHGHADTVVGTDTAISLMDHAEAEDMRLLLVKGADHSFSDSRCLPLIEQAILDVTPVEGRSS